MGKVPLGGGHSQNAAKVWAWTWPPSHPGALPCTYRETQPNLFDQFMDDLMIQFSIHGWFRTSMCWWV
jgi:hypothetical protein